MKNSENIKQVVFIIGSITLLVGTFLAISSKSLATNFFPIYIGLTLMGTAVMHKEENTKTLETTM